MAGKVEFDERIYDILLKMFETELNVGLEGYYVWEINKSVWNDKKVKLDVSPKFKEEISKEKSIPKQTIILKERLKNELNLYKNNNDVYLNFAHWVIQKWGGIPRSPTDDKLRSLQKKLRDDNSTSVIESVDTISSLSKVAAFYDDSKYAVYDSRVVFTLNWLIFINGLHEQDDPKGKMKFFRQPEGRNLDIKKHNQDTIFCLAYEKFDIDDAFYYMEKDSYNIYCELLKNTCEYYKKHKTRYKKIIEKENEAPKVTIGTLEMCLFSIAAEDKRLSKNKVKCNYGIPDGDKGGYITDQMDLVLRTPIVDAVKKERKRLRSKYSIVQ